MKNKPKAGKAVGTRNVALQRGLAKGQRLVELPTLIIDETKPMQRIEVIGLGLQDLAVKPLGLGEFAPVPRTLGAADEAGKILR